MHKHVHVCIHAFPRAETVIYAATAFMFWTSSAEILGICAAACIGGHRRSQLLHHRTYHHRGPVCEGNANPHVDDILLCYSSGQVMEVFCFVICTYALFYHEFILKSLPV